MLRTEKLICARAKAGLGSFWGSVLLLWEESVDDGEVSCPAPVVTSLPSIVTAGV